MKNGSEAHGKGGKQTGKITNVPSKTQAAPIPPKIKKPHKGSCK